MAVGNLEEYASLGEGVGSVQQALSQDADLPREEAIEASDSGDLRFGVCFRQNPPPRMFAIVHYIVALVKYFMLKYIRLSRRWYRGDIRILENSVKVIVRETTS